MAFIQAEISMRTSSGVDVVTEKSMWLKECEASS